LISPTNPIPFIKTNYLLKPYPFMITVIGIFADPNLAEQASEYLLANEFESENIDLHTHNDAEPGTDRVGDFFGNLYNDAQEASHYASLGRDGTVVTVHAASAREAQEAVDVFNNHGAIEVNADEGRSLIVDKVIGPGDRLRD
jgi:hypothetical protein